MEHFFQVIENHKTTLTIMFFVTIVFAELITRSIVRIIKAIKNGK